MITAPIIHPPILGALAAAGHKSTIMIADAHFAAATTSGSRATVAYLNFTAGTPLTTDVLATLAQMVPFERYTSMLTPEAIESPVCDEVKQILDADVPHDVLEREAFYDLIRSDNLILCIVTGDTRRFANILVTVGVNTQTAVS
ncbi:RbsD/FucU domain-containing protein [Salinibacterium sp. SWN248]|uniref:RbsD/FucU domain-containing protein n=1 Tax=Salinibacterium sp. SWN248 TaxID=2792056 RepID=UPI0018CCE8ED|nr:RbsD/FucU domain-containing protein [Salinibacterium sp. SWN248]MBH0023440.1 RbsD/FucU family protein [Salinibacterium sp. SWN248]